MELLYSIIKKQFAALVLILFYGCSTGNEIVINNNGKTDIDTSSTNYVNTDVVCWLTSPTQRVYLKRNNIALNFENKTNNYETITVDDSKQFQSMDYLTLFSKGKSFQSDLIITKEHIQSNPFFQFLFLLLIDLIC